MKPTPISLLLALICLPAILVLPANAVPSCYNELGPEPETLPGKCGKPDPDGNSDTEDDGGGSPSEMPPLGPSPHSGSTPPSGAVETPKTVIGTYHGGALLDTTDLKVPGALSGIPLEFTRFYNSRDAEGLGDLMGHGRTWTHSFS